MMNYEKPGLPHIIFGSGTYVKVGTVLTGYNVTKCLIVTDPGVMNLGMVDKVGTVIEAHGIQYDVFKDVMPDPLDTVALQVAEIIKNGGYDGVVALGGGSPMDVAKAAALIASFEESVEDLHDYRRTGPKARTDWKRNYPLVTIPTTSGTGAEVTSSAVITYSRTNLKFSFGNEAIHADTAIIDPEFTLGMPAGPTINGAMDALSHALENVVGNSQSEYSNMMMLECIERVWKWLPIAVAEPNDLEAREQLSWAAHNSEANGGIPNGHAVGHALSSFYHLIHGHSCVIVLPTVIRHHAEASQKAIAEIAKRIGVPVTGDAKVDAERVAQAVHRFYKSFGLMSLKEWMDAKEYEDDRETYIQKMIPFVLDDFKSTTWNPPIHLDENMCGKVCGMVYDDK